MPQPLLLSLTLLAGLLCSFNNLALAAESHCFLDAETYYEQVYCEIKDRDPSTRLPSFIDFKKNPAKMQALLLMRKAKALGIEINMPPSNKPESENRSPKKAKHFTVNTPGSCQLKGQEIICADGKYVQVGNLPNKTLKEGVLNGTNRLILENYKGSRTHSQQMIAHLTQQYIIYLQKMLEIGLGGETMSFTKFHSLFQDISAKGVDFAKRFDTMFQFLKRDKTNINVRKAIEPLTNIDISNCAQLTGRMFTCDNRKRNTIYLKQ